MANSEDKKIIKAASTIAGATLLSRVLGFIRDMIMARFFGATAAADAFYVAYRIPNLFRELLAEGTMSAAFVPVFTEYLATKEREEARKLASGVFTALLTIATLFVVIGIFTAPYLVLTIAYGFKFDPEKFNTTVYLTRLMFPFLLFISLSALTMGMLNSLRLFFVPALGPAILNVFIISTILILTPVVDPPVSAAAYGVLFGGVFPLLLQVYFLKREGMLFRFSAFWTHPGVKKIFKLMGPVVAGLSVTQVNLLINTILASFLAVGSVSFLYYGMRLIHFPLGILGVAISTAILPSFATLAAKKDFKGLNETLSFGLRMVLFITIPAMIGLIFFRIPIVNLLFQHGEFDYNATLGTSGAILYYAVGIWSFASVRIITQVFYSLQDTKTPMKTAALSVACGTAASLVLIQFMAHKGLALATSLASMLNLSILLYRYNQRNGISLNEIFKTAFYSLAAAVPIALAGIFVSSHFPWNDDTQVLLKAGIIACSVIGSVAIYFSIHHFMKSPELEFFMEQVRKRKSTG